MGGVPGEVKKNGGAGTFCIFLKTKNQQDTLNKDRMLDGRMLVTLHKVKIPDVHMTKVPPKLLFSLLN